MSDWHIRIPHEPFTPPPPQGRRCDLIDEQGAMRAMAWSEQDAVHIAQCVNACRCIPTNVVGPVLDLLFTAMMTAKATQESSAFGSVHADPDLLRAAALMEKSGVNLAELLTRCRLEKRNNE